MTVFRFFKIFNLHPYVYRVKWKQTKLILHDSVILFQSKVYMSVVEDVISNVREAFLDEGIDEQVLHELKQVNFLS